MKTYTPPRTLKDRQFRYTPAANTDIKVTFKRAARRDRLLKRLMGDKSVE